MCDKDVRRIGAKVDDSLIKLFDSIFVISHDPIDDRRSTSIYIQTP
jgi:hypothetical protein